MKWKERIKKKCAIDTAQRHRKGYDRVTTVFKVKHLIDYFVVVHVCYYMCVFVSRIAITTITLKYVEMVKLINEKKEEEEKKNRRKRTFIHTLMWHTHTQASRSRARFNHSSNYISTIEYCKTQIYCIRD